MHVDEIKALASKAHSDAALREGLFAAMLGGGRTEAVQAAWALTHLPKEDTPHIDGHREALTRLAIATADSSLRRLTLALLERLPWNAGCLPAKPSRAASPHAMADPPEHYLQLLDFCLGHMMLASEPYGVRSLCMKLACRLALPYPELLGELRQNLLLLEPSELGAGVRCTRNKLLKSTNI